jgi:hypothetical protein
MSNPEQVPTLIDLYVVIQQLQQQVQFLQQNQTPTSIHVSDPRIPDVATFGGNRKHLKSFLLQLEIKFTAQPNMYATENSKLAYTISRLTDGPLEWAAPLLREDKKISTVQELFNQLTATFGDHEEVPNSRTQLLKLKQGNRPCIDYTTDFIRLATLTQWDKATHLGIYLNGLNEELQYALSLVDQPTDFDKFTAVAIRTDNRLFARKKAMLKSNSHISMQNSNLRPYTSTPVPMELDSFQTAAVSKKDFRQPLTKEEKARRKSEGLCPYCSGKHTLDLCNLRPKNSSSRR